MECFEPSSNEVKLKKKPNNNITINNIIKEYSLKRNNFNPNGSSPNKFLVKLEQRMKIYYNDLNNF